MAKLLERRGYFESPDEEEAIANALLDKLNAAPFQYKLAARHKWQQAVATAVYCTSDSKDIPYEDLKIIAKLSTDEPLRTKYAEKIKSPVTGIRAFCYNCQGCDIAGVRNCTNSVCPLFPFRMGKNVFSGKLTNADADAVEDIEELELTDADQEA